MIKKKLFAFAGLAASLVLASTPAQAEWSNWSSIGTTGVEWRYTQVYKDMCALGFRNATGRTLKGMKMEYIHSGKTDKDLLPYPLKPGQQLSGWAAFSVGDSCGNVRVHIYDVEWD